MKIFPLSEGAFTVDATKVFQPFNKETDDLQQRPHGSLLVEVQPFAVQTESDLLLFDTGLGFADADNEMQIHRNLRAHGFAPEEVTKVLVSHLHKDHAGGISRPDDRTKLSFPQAEYYVDRQEFDSALSSTKSSYITEEFLLLRNNPKVVFTEGDGEITGGIHYEVTGGHSPFHRCFKVTENDEIVFFGGDVAPQLQQMRNRFVAKYDFDGKRSMQLRQDWRSAAEAEGWTMLFYHDIKTPYFKF